MSMRKFLSLSLSILVESVATRVNHQTVNKFKSFPNYCTFKDMGSVICKNAPTTDAGKNKQEKMVEEDTEYIEDIVCKSEDIKENEMKAFDLKDVGKVLVVRQNGQLSALGNKCTHYGAPLDKGALGKGFIRCQWHGACFNILTGDIEDFPGLDSLPCFQVSVEDNNIKVRARKSDIQDNKRVKSMCKQNTSNSTHMVVIGGGPSGAVCVETLRQEGFTGKITLVNKENCLPYDRVKVSKTMDLEIEKVELRKIDFYREHNIEIIVNTEATSVDTATKKVTLSNGTTLDYDFLYVATGSKPRELEVPGGNLPQICVLRGFEDSKKVNNMLTPESNVVCLGSSFISMEAAAYCANKAKSVTVIGRGNAPFKPVFGEAVGLRMMELFVEKGVQFIMNNEITKCNSEDGKLKSVELLNGQIIPADILIIGLGSTLYTDFLKDSGVTINQDGSITVNEFLETNVTGIFAGGDIAHAPVFCNDNNRSTIGHYPLAHYHGRIAGLNMLGKCKALQSVPYFWTMLFGKSLRYAGHGRHDEVKIVGDLNELKYFAFHFKGDKVIAMSSCQQDPIVSQFANFLSEGKQLFRRDIETDPLAWRNEYKYGIYNGTTNIAKNSEVQENKRCEKRLC